MTEVQEGRRGVRVALLLVALLVVLGVLIIQRGGGLEALFSGESGEPAGDPVLAALRDAERIEDPYQRCLQYPQPRRVEWPDAVIEAFCADEFTPILAYRTIESRINWRLIMSSIVRPLY